MVQIKENLPGFIAAVLTGLLCFTLVGVVSAWAGSDVKSLVRLSFGPQGMLIVTDYNQGPVYLINSKTLKVVDTFEIKGRLSGIAWLNGRVFVGNESTGRVGVYSPNGRWLFDLGAVVQQPTDIGVDDQAGLLFVLDGYGKNIKVFNGEGMLLSTIAEGLLTAPTGIAVDPGSGEIFVSDFSVGSLSTKAWVWVLDYEGNVLRSISGAGAGFSRPQGLALDNEGHLYLADGVLGQILVLNRVTGERLSEIGSFGWDKGQLVLPLDVAYDESSGNLYVTNNRAGRIEVFTERRNAR